MSDKIKEALALARRWLGNPDDPNGTFEDIASWCLAETGILRPGKDDVSGMSLERRRAVFETWCVRKKREIVAALKEAADDG